VASISSTWAPAGVVATLITGGIIAVPMSANAVDLPERSVEDIIALMELEPVEFSGTVVKTTDLGLPALEMSQMISEEMVAEMQESMPEGFDDFVPQLIEDNTITEAIAFVAGTDTVRLYVSELGLRAQILDPLSQRDVVINATEFWAYNARTQSAVTKTFDQELAAPNWDDVSGSLEVDLSNPDALVAAFLEQAGDGTTITVGDNVMVAGRAAYTLIVEPGTPESLVDQAVVHIEAETGLGLGLAVYSTEQAEAAIDVTFETISLEAPDASLFSFSPPPGTTVETLEVPAEFEAARAALLDDTLSEAQAEELVREFADTVGEGSEPQRIGEGWNAVVFLDAVPSSVPLEMLQSELFSDLVVSVPGGSVFSTPLVNVFLSDTGSVYAGAVTVDYLLSLAAG
jgi:outer membrane lipoprotein-sorting protein